MNRPTQTRVTRDRVAAAAVMLLTLGTTLLGTASAQTIYQQQVYGQFELVLAEARARGVQPTHEPFLGYVLRGRTDVVTLDLRANRRYAVFGFCDSDCRDLDLELFDENGERIDDDMLINDTPVVGVTPAWSGPFSIRVSVPDCRASRCTYGLLVLGD